MQGEAHIGKVKKRKIKDQFQDCGGILYQGGEDLQETNLGRESKSSALNMLSEECLDLQVRGQGVS